MISNDGSAKKALLRLQAQCSKREYCISDIRQKALKAMDGDEEAAEEICKSLVEDNFVDDFRYAYAFAREKSALSGWGRIKISFALSAKKIDRETIGKALEEIDSDKAGDRLQKLLETKWRSLAGGCKTPPQDAKLKLIRFALSRGYDYETVKPLIEKF